MESLVNQNSAIPLYRQVADNLLSRIQAGEWQENDKLPSEFMLIQEFNVSRITIRAALSELVDNGVLIRSHGRGTFVAPRKEKLRAAGDVGFTRSCAMEGKKATNMILNQDLVFPSKKDMAFFQIPQDERIIRIKRLRYVDNKPCVIETLHFAPQYHELLQADVTGSVTDTLLRIFGVRTGEGERTVDVCMALEEEADYLNTEADTPMLLLEDRQYDTAGEPLFLSKQIFCTKFIKLYL